MWPIGMKERHRPRIKREPCFRAARLTLLAVVLLCRTSALAGFEQGVQAHDRGDFATAMQEFEAAARKGDLRAQYNLGVMYQEGLGVERDAAVAGEWFKQAAAQAAEDEAARPDLGEAAQLATQPAKWFRQSTQSAQTANQGTSSLGFSDAPVELGSLLVNLMIGVVISLVLAMHFRLFSTTLTNRDNLAFTFPFILLTTLLIITIVKSSLALSLGLVGALSIVRFRTPIKEPEELAYLFMAIAVGLGLGANQRLPTVVAVAVILVVMALLKRRQMGNRSENLFLSVDFTEQDGQTAPSIDTLARVINGHVVSNDLRRFDQRDGTLEATYLVQLAGPQQLGRLIETLRTEFPGLGITFLDQDRLTAP